MNDDVELKQRIAKAARLKRQIQERQSQSSQNNELLSYSFQLSQHRYTGGSGMDMTMSRNVAGARAAPLANEHHWKGNKTSESKDGSSDESDESDVESVDLLHSGEEGSASRKRDGNAHHEPPRSSVSMQPISDGSGSSRSSSSVACYDEKIRELKKKRNAERGIELIREMYGDAIIDGKSSPNSKKNSSTTTTATWKPFAKESATTTDTTSKSTATSSRTTLTRTTSFGVPLVDKEESPSTTAVSEAFSSSQTNTVSSIPSTQQTSNFNQSKGIAPSRKAPRPLFGGQDDSSSSEDDIMKNYHEYQARQLKESQEQDKVVASSSSKSGENNDDQEVRSDSDSSGRKDVSVNFRRRRRRVGSNVPAEYVAAPLSIGGRDDNDNNRKGTSDAFMDTDSESSEKEGGLEESKRRRRRGRRRRAGSRTSPKSKEATKTKDDKSKKQNSGGDSLSETDFTTTDSEECIEDENADSFKMILKPEFEQPKFEPSALEPYALDEEKHYQIPASMNRYVQEYQREGVSFLFNLVMKEKGALLGDDMGLGKTVQAISLIAALLKKKGTNEDKIRLRDRRKAIEKQRKMKLKQKDQDLLVGNVTTSEASSTLKHDSPFAPVLIIVPPSLISQWKSAFDDWGHFGVSLYQGASRDRESEMLEDGINDVMIVGVVLFREAKDHFKNIPWKLVIFDEFHQCKNANSLTHKAMRHVMDNRRCPLIGMTGTPMSNDLMDMWTLVDLVQPGLLGDSSTYFKEHFANPIKNARTKDARSTMIEHGEKRNRELTRALKKVYLKRNKSDVLKDDLKKKDEIVMFCQLTNIQKQIYQHILTLPDYTLLKNSNAPCNCDANSEYRKEYFRLKTMAEKVEYARRNESFKRRKECCWRCPYDPEHPSLESIDPRAALWIKQHPGGKDCERCPDCLLFPALQKLHKICSHASLLQLERDPSLIHDGGEKKKALDNLEFAKVALPETILQQLPGASYIRKESIMNAHTVLSGKMKMLDKLLMSYNDKGDRVLVFSYSTKTLDLIQQFIKSKGYIHLRLDGSTPMNQRASMVNEFQRNPNIFVFLISTKAGAVGLNLTSANRVILFDVNWDPSLDSQAQDRAYRIGQERDVEVVRLVTRGTIEEQIYARQVYKIHLSTQTLESGKEGYIQQPRLFKGIKGDKDRKGELFGIENLLKFKDGSFIEDIWKSKSEFKRSELIEQLQNKTEDEIENLGQDEECVGLAHEDFLREDKGEAALQPGDYGYDEEMGGESQAVFNNLAAFEGRFLTNNNEESTHEREANEEKEEKLSDSNVKPTTRESTTRNKCTIPQSCDSVSNIDYSKITNETIKKEAKTEIQSAQRHLTEESTSNMALKNFSTPLLRRGVESVEGVLKKNKKKITPDALYLPSYLS